LNFNDFYSHNKIQEHFITPRKVCNGMNATIKYLFKYISYRILLFLRKNRVLQLSPTSHTSVNVVTSDICDEDLEKRDYARSISKKTQRGLDWFKPSWRVIALHPALLYYAMKRLVAPDELWAATYIDCRTAL
jgi:hypothetical protein